MSNPPSQTTAVPPPARLIHEERAWLEPPRTQGRDAPRIIASRWTGSAARTCEHRSAIDGDRHLVAIALRPVDAAIFAGGALIADGRIAQGSAGISRPGQSLRAVFRGSYDVLHLHVSNSLLADCLREAYADPPCIADVFAAPRTLRDPAIEGLAQSLVRADEVGEALGPQYVECIGIAILARLLRLQSAETPAGARPRVSALAKWRLKRTTEYLEAHLAEPIGLADLAAASGLSRMHFAAQFRAATGMRPHDYLLWRRIDRAMGILRSDRRPLCEVALDVGFKTQAHFTTVFRRVVGTTPNEWRQENADPRRVAAVPREPVAAVPREPVAAVPREPVAAVPRDQAATRPWFAGQHQRERAARAA
jgi:AraC-like DNA-binding protein